MNARRAAANRPRIALVTDAIAPFHRGGKEQRYAELLRHMTTYGDVHVYTMNWWRGARRIRRGQVTYHAICPLLPLYSGDRRSIRQALLFALGCFRLLFARFDLIEADHMPYLQLFTLKLVCVIRRRRLVVTWHECWGAEYWRSYLGLPGIIGWWVERLSLMLPDRIIAASSHTGERLRQLVGARTEVLDAPSGVDLQAAARVPAGQPRVDVITVCRLLPHKRVDLLLRALALLRQRGRECSACVVGRGPQLEALRALAEQLGLSGLVNFRDDLEGRDALFSALKSARVAVFCSEREGFGVAVLEALACGVPVITTSAPANHAQHLVRASDAGVVCRPDPAAVAEALASLLDGQHESRVNRRWLERFDWSQVAQQVALALA